MSTSISQLRQRPDGASRTAFVLSGGGNQAVAQVGMLRALFERDIVPDVLVGTSAGRVQRVVIAATPSLRGVERLEGTWESLRGEEVFPGGACARAWNLLTRDDHLFSNQGLRALFRAATPPPPSRSCVVPLRVVAADLDTGEEVVFAAGPLEPALLASAALPGLLPADSPRRPHPGRRRGRQHGAAVARARRAGRPDLRAQRGGRAACDRPLRSPIDVAIRAFAISRKQRFELELRNVPESVEVVVLPGAGRRPGGVRLLRSRADAHRRGATRLAERFPRRAPSREEQAPPSTSAARGGAATPRC